MNESFWKKVSIPHFPRLSEESRRSTRVLKFDDIIVGGGLTGLVSAYFLKKAGRRVCVLERGTIGCGDTGNTTAHLTGVTDKRLSALVKGFGERNARLVWDAGEAAINMIEIIVRECSIDCDFKRSEGYLHASLETATPTEKEITDLAHEATIAHDLGIDAIFEQSVPLTKRPGVRFTNQAKFHPLLFIAELAKLIPGRGCAIYEGSEVTEIESDPLVVHCGGATIKAKNVIVGTHVPIQGNGTLASAALFQTKIMGYSSYVIGASIPQNRYPEVMLWDTSDPYFYTRIDRGRYVDYVIFGGKDHKTGQLTETSACYVELENKLKQFIPDAAANYRWSGQVWESHDGLPLIGNVTPTQFVATGFGGNGTTFGTLGASMARDWILQRESPWQELFSTERKEVHAGGAWSYVRENLDYPVYMLKDRLVRREEFSPELVDKGEGKILKVGGKTVACSREMSGELHVVSAICPHLGGIVHWNGAEKTWDCPCHGSRFKPDGSVLAGPAETALDEIPFEPGDSRAPVEKPEIRKEVWL